MKDVKFELGNVTTRQMASLLKAIRENDLFTIAEYFSQVVTECPSDWGDPASPDTYLDLPYFTLFTELTEAMGKAGQAMTKN